MIERVFGDDGDSSGLESSGKCPKCGELDGLESAFEEKNGKLIFAGSSECSYCDYAI